MSFDGEIWWRLHWIVTGLEGLDTLITTSNALLLGVG